MDVEKLEVYKKAFALSILVYKTTRSWNEYWVRDQMMRSVTSVCANLCEMAGSKTEKEKHHKATIALCEAKETQFWIKFAHETGMLPNQTDFINDIDVISKMLWNYRNAIIRKPPSAVSGQLSGDSL